MLWTALTVVVGVVTLLVVIFVKSPNQVIALSSSSLFRSERFENAVRRLEQSGRGGALGVLSEIQPQDERGPRWPVDSADGTARTWRLFWRWKSRPGRPPIH